MNLADIRKFTAQLAPRILIHGAEGVGSAGFERRGADSFLKLQISSFGRPARRSLRRPA